MQPLFFALAFYQIGQKKGIRAKDGATGTTKKSTQGQAQGLAYAIPHLCEQEATLARR